MFCFFYCRGKPFCRLSVILINILWFSPDTPISSTDKTDRHIITDILLKMALSTITLNLINILQFF